MPSNQFTVLFYALNTFNLKPKTIKFSDAHYIHYEPSSFIGISGILYINNRLKMRVTNQHRQMDGLIEQFK